MTTFDQLTDVTLQFLSGYAVDQAARTHLTAPLTVDGLSVAVANAERISPGLVQIGDELLWVDAVDQSSATVQFAPYGRGHMGTSASEHAINDELTVSPLFPRATVKRVINETIQAVFPALFRVQTYSFDYNPVVTAYALPAGTVGVLGVRAQHPSPSADWPRLRRYDLDRHANVSKFPSGVALNLYEGGHPGLPVQVLCAMAPATLVSGTDEFDLVTGLPSSCEDVIRLGAAHRLVPFLDTPHTALLSAEADFSAGVHQPSNPAMNLARYFWQNYQTRLAEEGERLRAIYPVTLHYTS